MQHQNNPYFGSYYYCMHQTINAIELTNPLRLDLLSELIHGIDLYYINFG